MLCLSCYQDGIAPETEHCPACGLHLPTLMRDVLPSGHLLHGGKYELNYPLGKGGCGWTYLALHRTLNKQVAIKEYFPPDISHRTVGACTVQSGGEQSESYRKGLQRFLREGQVLGRIRHPNVVGVEDFFDENNTAYLVMEYLQGRSLKQELSASGGQLSPARIKVVMGQLVEALAVVHEQGVYHLDLKPENVLIEGSRVKLIDFGSARPEGGSPHSTRSINQKYAPIEVIANGLIGPYSDIFELGVMLHEMLTGHLPPEVMHRLMNPHWKPEGIPEDFRHLLDQALQIQPADRPSSVISWWQSLSEASEKNIQEEFLQLQEANRQLTALSRTDGLTGIANRRHFDEVLALEHARHTRSGTRLALILMDIDHFKAFNDHYGHIQGDECLRLVAQVLSQSTGRASDLPARYGGEEFACILPDTDLPGAVVVAERIRAGILARAIPHAGSSVSDKVTASLGVVSVLCKPGESVLQIVTQADALLYNAKATGRNRVVFEPA